MANKKSLPAIIGGVALVLVAGYFGVDLGSGQQGSSSQSSTTAQAPAGTEESSKSECPLDTLPREASETWDDIEAGGPFEYPENDGSRFGNYEGVLPDEQLGYYREYTVDTPGLNHRGERRIVTGGGTETDPDVVYYTDDHYESFCEVPGV